MPVCCHSRYSSTRESSGGICTTKRVLLSLGSFVLALVIVSRSFAFQETAGASRIGPTGPTALWQVFNRWRLRQASMRCGKGAMQSTPPWQPR